MPRLLILLTLPPDVTEQYRDRLAQRFPEIGIDLIATADKAAAALPEADMLLTFGQMMKNLKLDFANAGNLKWVQALGTGVDNLIDLPSLRPDVIITNIRGIHGAPVSEAAIMMMLGLAGVTLTTAVFAYVDVGTSLWWIRGIMFVRGCFFSPGWPMPMSASTRHLPRGMPCTSQQALSQPAEQPG